MKPYVIELIVNGKRVAVVLFATDYVDAYDAASDLYPGKVSMVYEGDAP